MFRFVRFARAPGALPSAAWPTAFYVGEFGTLTTRRQNGLCRRHHSAVAQAIKRARHMAFLPFVGKPAK